MMNNMADDNPPPPAFHSVISALLKFESLLFSYVFSGARFSDPCCFDNDLRSKVHIFSLSLIFSLWSHPHYRNSSYQQDMRDNLRNVCIPNTGVKLSIFCLNWPLAYFFVAVIYPIVCFVAAWMAAVSRSDRRPTLQGSSSSSSSSSSIPPNFVSRLRSNFCEHLLHPKDWFSLWRLNCNLIAYHSFITKSRDYRQEDKWTFLFEGDKLGCPVSPFMNMRSIVCKNKLIEGGMGIHFFKNACFGGDWIIQEALDNAQWLKELLPKDAPLSTMRVVAASSFSLSGTQNSFDFSTTSNFLSNSENSNKSNSNSTINNSNNKAEIPIAVETCSEHNEKETEKGHELVNSVNGIRPPDQDVHPNAARQDCGRAVRDACVEPLSCVLRLGRAGAATDHQSILYNVLMEKDNCNKNRDSDSSNSNISNNSINSNGSNCSSSSIGSKFDATNSRAGIVDHGSVNSQWYQLGWSHFFWLPVFLFNALIVNSYKFVFESNISQQKPTADVTSFDCHPDAPYPKVVGMRVPPSEYNSAIEIVKTWHYRMMPDVPLVGWDVAFTEKGIFLLEVNLSCNFFQGHLDFNRYYQLIGKFFVDLEVPRARVIRDDVLIEGEVSNSFSPNCMR